ncbi:hypothetical protein FACS1894200_00410 [Spirochaetia bacterium]|nr:hypothetical protein FACS1894200_00410 [Spirochaetia bacterium]
MDGGIRVNLEELDEFNGELAKTPTLLEDVAAQNRELINKTLARIDMTMDSLNRRKMQAEWDYQQAQIKAMFSDDNAMDDWQLTMARSRCESLYAACAEAQRIQDAYQDTVGLYSRNETSCLQEFSLLQQKSAKIINLYSEKVRQSVNALSGGGGAGNARGIAPSKASSAALTTRNQDLEGKKHPETGVPFERKTVKDAEGNSKEGVFPQFESKYDAQLFKDLYKESDAKQFKECNKQLKEYVEHNPKLAKDFNPEQQEQIKNGDTPDGYTWHHREETGKMQLVDSETHAQTGHTGGKTVWGGGNENR